MRRWRWQVITNATFAGLVLGIILFWNAVEAPAQPAQSHEGDFSGTPLEVLGVVTTFSTPEASPTASPTAIPPIPQEVRVPILMYHRIDWLPPNADALRRSLSITPTEFDQQVSFLRERGIVSVSLYDVYEAVHGRRKLPPKPVVLTFDDGYADNYANAFPILQKHGFTGTFFILTDVAGTGEYMNWEQLREMASAGQSIEVHGRTHTDLTKLTGPGVAGQAAGAKEAIRTRLGVTPAFYSYPSGRYNSDVIEIVKANGFLAAVTTNYGRDHSVQKLLELTRVRIDGREGFTTFAKKVGENP